MTSRRSFFSRLAKAAAIIAVAQKIASRAPKMVVATESPRLDPTLYGCSLTRATIHRFSFEDFKEMKRIEEGRALPNAWDRLGASVQQHTDKRIQEEMIKFYHSKMEAAA